MEDKYSYNVDEIVELVQGTQYKLVYSAMKLKNNDVTMEQVTKIINKENIDDVPKETRERILSLNDGWKFLVQNIDKTFDLTYISRANLNVSRNEGIEFGVLRYGNMKIEGTDKISPIPVKEKIEEELSKILSIENVTLKAIKIYIFIVKKQLFWNANRRTAFICANRILMASGKGVFMVKDENIEEFKNIINGIFDNKSEDEIVNYIYNNCIWGLDELKE